MKKIILLLTAFFFLLNTQGQVNIDSLKLLLQNEKQDTGKVMLLSGLSLAYAAVNPDTAKLMALQALSLSQRIGFNKGTATNLTDLAYTYYLEGDFPRATDLWLQALKLNEKINNLAGIARDLNAMGMISHVQGEYRQAIDYFVKSKKINEQIGNKNEIRINLENLGNDYLSLKQFDSARLCAQQIYEVSGKEALFLMGGISSATGQNKLALEYYRLSINAKYITNKPFLAIAKLFEKEGQFDSALLYAKRYFELVKHRNVLNGLINASIFLSAFYENRGNIDSAFFYLKIAKTTNDSVFSKDKMNRLKSYVFDEKLRQIEMDAAKLKAEEERSHNLQYAAIAVVLISFLILFFTLSRSIIVETKFIEFFGVLGLLAFFEFINLLIHPYLSHATNDSPVLMLLVLIAIGALLVPLHHRLEKWITKIMVEKNKKIRLEAAHKTIAKLGGGKTKDE